MSEVDRKSPKDYAETVQKVKKKRRNHSKLGKEFVAPDGGFGWFVCLAAGCSNVFIYSEMFCILVTVF